MERKFIDLNTYNPKHIRGVASMLINKYQDLKAKHVFWVAKELNIYPDAKAYKNEKSVYMTSMGKINTENKQYVDEGNRSYLTDIGIKAIEEYILSEGYITKPEMKEEKMADTKSIWEQADLISLMKKDYEKAVKEKEDARSEAEQYWALADKYEKEVEELKDKLLIAEKENSSLKSEKTELSKMQIEIPNFNKEIENLQMRIGKYGQEINVYISEVNELRKEIQMMNTAINRLQDNKKKLEGVLSDLVGCSKRLMNMK